MVVIVMGVAGSGKTSIGMMLASDLGCDFRDADDLHSQENRYKMHRGLPLTDEDRRPWLAAVRALIDRYEESGTDAVIACSALKEAHRAVLTEGTNDIRLVYLKGSMDLIAQRLAARHGHFFDPALLRSQFEVLEEPNEAIVVDVGGTPAEIVAAVHARLAKRQIETV
jgi:gluconokinase